MRVKMCTLCKKDIDISLFRKSNNTKDGLQERCKPCKKEIEKGYRNKNKKKIAESNKMFYYSKLEENRIRSNINAKKSYIKNKEKYKEKYILNKVIYNKRSIKYRKNNIEKVRIYTNKYVKRRKIESPAFKIKYLLRTRMLSAITRGYKKKSTVELLGCEYDYLKSFLENKFREGMSWANHGEWEIDHIKPCASFDLMQEVEQKKCFNYTNLQPLWKADNRKKRDKILCTE